MRERGGGGGRATDFSIFICDSCDDNSQLKKKKKKGEGKGKRGEGARGGREGGRRYRG